MGLSKLRTTWGLTPQQVERSNRTRLHTVPLPGNPNLYVYSWEFSMLVYAALFPPKG